MAKEVKIGKQNEKIRKIKWNVFDEVLEATTFTTLKV